MELTANGATLHVLERGAGDPALVFLHYFGGSSRAWSGVMDGLVGAHRCVAPDLRGFGGSETTVAGYTVGEGADDVAALVRARELAHYVIIGHSMGGKIGLALAARHPPGLRALVLVAPSPPTPEPMAAEERARLLATHGDRAAAAETVRTIAAHPLAAPLRDRAIGDALRSSGPAWSAWLERGSREDITGAMSGIAVPLLVVAGAADPVVPADLLRREVVRRVAGARLAIVPGVGHLIPLEAPGPLIDLIREFLDANAAGV